MWGLDFDRRGNPFASTNVGGFVMLHAVQGGYYWKAFGKHGPLHNPYTFGYFDHVPHEGVRGGHVTVGGLFYEAETLPPRFRGKFLTGDLLEHGAHWHSVTPRGSTFRARQEGDLLRANDTWFAPSDMTLGPDGAVYIADWHDKRTAHPDPDADWDRSNGRIYRLAATGTKPAAKSDLAAKSSAELVELLGDANVWYVRKARRLLGERRDASVMPVLRKMVEQRAGIPALEALWALYLSGGMDSSVVDRLLGHRDEDVRAWTVRLLGEDPPRVAGRTRSQLLTMAKSDPSVRVRAQLACYAQRDPQDGLAIALAILDRDLDGDDPHLQLLLWWVVERHARERGPTMTHLWSSPWKSAMTRAAMARLMRRYAAEDGLGCAEMLATRDQPGDRKLLLEALDATLAGHSAQAMPAALKAKVAVLAKAEPDDEVLRSLMARFGDRSAQGMFVATAFGLGLDDTEADRLKAFALLADLHEPRFVGFLLPFAVADRSAAICLGALKALARFDDPKIPSVLLMGYSVREAVWRAQARELMLGRRDWARALLEAVDSGRLDAKEIPLEQVARVALLGDAELDSLVRKHWGKVSGGTPEEKLAEVRRLNNDLRAAPGDLARGKALFEKQCAGCHRLFDMGSNIGPELTHANRKDRDFLLVSLVDPNAVVRREYQATLVETRDGRVLSGLIAEQNPGQLTLVTSATERTTIPRGEIAAMTDSPTSLMPENLYREFNPEQLRDLFAYLQAEEPRK
jgi:putative heme-binding domain-containing protein